MMPPLYRRCHFVSIFADALRAIERYADDVITPMPPRWLPDAMPERHAFRRHTPLRFR